MVTKIYFIIFCIVITILFSKCSCNKEILGCANNTYSFTMGANVYPDKDSIRIGDTLWLEASTPTSVKDTLTGETINYSGAENMDIAISLLSFDENSIGNPNPVYALDRFNYFIQVGSLYTTDQYANNYLFNESNETYNFKIGIVTKQTGLYAMSISDATNVYRKNNKCTKASFQITYQQTNQHMYFYQNLYSGQQISDYEQTHLYCFKVY